MGARTIIAGLWKAMQQRGSEENAMNLEPFNDTTGWMVTGTLAEFLLMHHMEVRFMGMVGYALWHGAHVFHHVKGSVPTSYLLSRFFLEVTGGAIIVPILLHSIPVPIALDSFALAVLIAFLVHKFIPMFRSVLEISDALKVGIVVLYEAYRAFEVVEFTAAAQETIGTSDVFGFPFFGPVICGAIAGCGGEFLPFDKGLRPLDKGLAQGMITSLMGAAFYSLFVNTSWMRQGVVDAEEKAHFIVAAVFVTNGLRENVRFDRIIGVEPNAGLARVAKKDH